MTGSLYEYLASDENIILSFGAESVTSSDGNNSTQRSVSSMHSFGATDRRIVYLGDNGSFKDIEYQHISSIESKSESKEPVWAIAGAIAAGCCGILLFVGGVTGIADDPVAGLLALLLGTGLLTIAVKLYQNGENRERQKIKLITGDEADQQLEFTTSENIGAELSQIVRENR